MEYPWEVIGFENVISEKTGKPGVRLYVTRPLFAENGTGVEAGRLFYRSEYVQYSPELGHKIIATEGRYGIDRIVRVG